MLIETLITSVGAAIAESLLFVFFQENPATVIATDIISSRVKDVILARKVRREFEELGDKIAKSLKPVFEGYENDQQQDEIAYESVAHEVSRAIAKAEISASLLAKLNYSPENLSTHIRSVYQIKSDLFSARETSLYNRSIDLASQYVIDLAINLPDYTQENFEEILTRLDESIKKLDRIFENIEQLRIASEQGNVRRMFAEFEEDYRKHVIRQLDRINIIGIDVPRIVKRYSLSIAYVSLQVHKEGLLNPIPIPVQHALQNAKRIAILGEAGSGKTTLLQWLAVNSAANSFERDLYPWRNSVPFFIALRRYRDNPPAPEHFLDELPQIAARCPANWIHNVLRDGRGVVLIDGLDEVLTSKRDRVIEWLENLVLDYPNCRFVFTSRPAAYEKGALSSLQFDEFSLAPMQYVEIQKFVEYWHKSVLISPHIEHYDVGQAFSKSLLEKLRNSIPLMRLATSPLLCAMLCAIHYDRHMQLPSDRKTLYEACVSGLMERRDAEKEVKLDLPSLTYPEKRLLIDDLAYWAIRNGYTTFSFDEALARMKTRFNNMNLSTQNIKVQEILKLFIERSGLIRQPALGTLDFVHKTFQEYMAASAASAEGDWGYLLKNATNDAWQETIILAAGFGNKSQASKLINGILDIAANDDQNEIYLNLLAIACLETALEISTKIRTRVEKTLNSLIPPRESNSIRYLAAAGDLAISYLTYNPNFSEIETINCVTVLGLIGTRPALTKLSHYIRDTRAAVRRRIIEVLDVLTTSEIMASGLAESLLTILSKELSDNDEPRISGSLIYSLSELDIEKIKSEMPSKLRYLSIHDFRESSEYFLELLTDVECLQLRGNIKFPFDILYNSNVKSLILWKDDDFWPNFDLAGSMEELRHLELKDREGVWPTLSLLGYIPKLSKLKISSFYDDDWPEMTEIGYISTLSHLHLSSFTTLGNLPDFERLSHLPLLDTIEITARSVDIESYLYGLSNLPKVKNLIINTDLEEEIDDATMTNYMRLAGKQKLIVNKIHNLDSEWQD